MKRHFSLRILFMGLLLFCTGSQTLWAQGPQKYGGVLRIIQGDSPLAFGFLNESAGADFASTMAAIPCTEALLKFDNAGKPHGALATSWEIAPDGKYVQLALRKGVKFHDGTEFNAEAAKWNLELAMSKGRNTTPLWTSVEVIDPYGIRINLKRFQNTILYDLESATAMMSSPTAVKNNGVEWAKTHPVGTGPFKFKEYKRDSHLEYERNDAYWDGKAFLDGIKFIYIKDPMTAQMAFQAGQADVLNMNNTSIASDLVQMGYKKETRPGAMFVLIPDSAHKDSIFSNKKVREAIEYAIDRSSLTKALGKGFYQPLNQPAARHHMGRIDDEGRPYNPVKAKQLLAEAGYPNGFKTTIITAANFENDPLQSIQSYLEKVGIEVKLEMVSFAKWNEHVLQGWNNSLLRVTQGATDTAFGAFLERYYYVTAARYKNTLARPEGLDELVTQGLAATDMEKQKSLYQKAVRMLVEDATVIPVYIAEEIYILQKNVLDTGFDQLSGSGFRWSTRTAWMNR